MRRLGALILVFGLAAPAVAAAEDAELSAFVHEARGKVKHFGETLKGELQAAMERDGPLEAISVCNVKAPEIAAKLSAPAGWRVARTAERLRNPNNAPDAWEAAVLAEFRQRAAAGESLDKMDKAERVAGADGPVFRYMKAIPTGQLCLTCHGDNLDPELKAKIASFYPDDQATGFKPGALRGAFTVSKGAE